MSHNQMQAPVYSNSITSVEKLEELLGLDELNLGNLKICAIADQSDGFYASFPLKKKSRPFARKLVSNKARPIDAPVHPLKTIQKRINETILAKICLPGYIM